MIIAISGKIGSGKDTVGEIIRTIAYMNKVGIPYSLEAVRYNMIEGNRDEEDVEWKTKKFADKLKQIVCLLTGCNREDLESQEFKRLPLSSEWDYVGEYDKKHPSHYSNDSAYKADPARFTKQYTYRDVLQLIGTELFRNLLHQNVWVNALFSDYKPYKIPNRMTKEFPKWIITDCRFPNEARAVKEHGGLLIRIKRTQWLKEGTLHVFEHPSETALDNYNFDFVFDNDGSIDDLINMTYKWMVSQNLVK